MFKGSWKTSSAGWIALLTSLATIGFDIYEGNLTRSGLMIQIPLIVNAIGLLFCRDNSVTSEQAGAK
jgi:hypothetical protein